MKKCPYCAEEIQDEALVCKHCGRDLKPVKKKRSQGFVYLVILFFCLLVVVGRLGRESSPTEISATPINTRGADSVVIVTWTPAPTSTRALTKTPLPTKSKAEKLYGALVDRLDKQIVIDVQFSGRDLIIQTRLTRSDLQAFYEDIGAIHGVIMRENPDVDGVILDDATGQKIVMSIEAMRKFYEGSIDWATFRSTWEVSNP